MKLTSLATRIILLMTSLHFQFLLAQFPWETNNRDDFFVIWDPTVPAGGVKSATWGGAYGTEAKRIVAQVCGTSRLCNISGIDTSKYSAKKDCSSCDQCYCDDVCVTYGDCCLDKVLNDVIGNTRILDTPVLTQESSYSSCFDTRARDTWIERNLHWRRLVTSCPRDYKNRDVIERCDIGRMTYYDSNAKVTTNALWDIWPVWSKGKSISYRNQACAECHGDHLTLEYWNLKVSCPGEGSMPYGITKIQALQYALDRDDCLVNFEVPMGANERKCTNFPNENPSITSCNNTGERQVFDPVLWKACESFPTKTKKHWTVYANVFCVVCEKDDRVMKWRYTCEGVLGGFQFFFVISPNAIRDAAGDKVTCGCPKDQTIDPIKNVCREVLCPHGYMLSRDQHQSNGHNYRCVDDGTLSMGLSYILNLEMTSDNDVPPRAITPDVLKTITMELRTKLVEKLHPLNSRDFSFEHFITYYLPNQGLNTNLTIGISTKFSVSESVSASSLAANIMKVAQSSWVIGVFLDNVTKQMAFASYLSPGPMEMVAFTAEMEENTVAYVPLQHNPESVMVYNLVDSRQNYAQYSDIKNTLICPYLVIGQDFQEDFYMDIEEENRAMFKDKMVFRYNQTNVNISFTDFYISPQGKVIVCAEAILNSWQDILKERKEEKKTFGKGLELTSVICLSVSCVCFVITLITYLIFPSLQTLPGKNTMALVLTMLLTMTLCLVIPLFDTWTVACQIVGVSTHFFLLSSVTWMVICTYRMYKIFTKIFDHTSGHNKSWKGFIRYIIVSIIIPATVITITIIVNYSVDYFDNDNNGDNTPNNKILNSTSSKDTADSDNTGSNRPIKQNMTMSCDTKSLTRIGYGEGVCYVSNQMSVLLAAALPILLAVFINCVFFCLTVVSMRKMSSEQQMVRKEPRRQMFIYIKLCALTGLNWLPGLLSVFVDSQVLWYAFLIFAGLQGLYVLVAFVLNARIMNMYKVKFCGQRLKRKDHGKAETKETALTDSHNQAMADNSKKHSNNDDVISTPQVSTIIADDTL